MSEGLADRPGSLWAEAPRAGSLRIGDAERDEAVTLLSEHFVAGRLTQDEFEQRSNQATHARYADELSPLFADLPEPAAVERGPQRWHPGLQPDFQAVRPPYLFLVPVLLIGLVTAAVLLSAPGILWLLFFLFLFARPHHRGRQHWHHHHRQVHAALHQRRPKPLGW